MNTPAYPTDPMPARAQAALSWLLAAVASVVAMVMAILVFALHSQQTSLEESRVQLLHAGAANEAELKHLTASNAIAEAEYQRLGAAYAEGVTALKQFEEAQAKRKAYVEQATKIQSKFQELVMDLFVLAKTDNDAKAIVAKYGISQNGTSPASGPAK